MPVTHYKCDGYESFQEVLKSLNNKTEPVFIMFSGSDDKHGKSWCQDCITAKPVVDEYIKSIEDKVNIHYVFVSIERAIWKDQSNPFRKDVQLQLKCIPTLMKLKGSQKLEGVECADKSLLKLVFGQ